MVAFKTMIEQIIKGNEWNIIYIDFHLGDKEDGSPIRKQLVAKRDVNGFSIYWQDISVFFDKVS